EDALLVFPVDAEDRREHPQRMSLRDLLDEVALALLAERVDQGARALGHDLVESLDGSRREEPARHLAAVAVLGRVHLDDREHLAHRTRRALGHLHLLVSAQDHRAFAIAEQMRLDRDVEDVRVLRDRPEVLEVAAEFAAMDRGLLAQTRPRVVRHALGAVVLRGHQVEGIDRERHRGLPSLYCLRISPFMASSCIRIGRPDSLSALPCPFWWISKTDWTAA